MKNFIIFIGVCYVLTGCYDKITSSKSSVEKAQGCYKYASNFSCNFVINEATYDVYYWKDVNDNNPANEKYVGTTTGINNCRDTAIFAHKQEMEARKKNNINWSTLDDNWSERSYICVLHKEGRTEKHRII
jgi:hypothetical protein